ncbi:MAG: hypothetical protein ABIQ51_22840 [Mesorhizobium sp.]
MEAVSCVPSAFRMLSALVSIAMAFIVMASFAATRLLVFRMRTRSSHISEVVGTFQPA